MKELDRLTTSSKSSKCLPTSSTCVRWEGPSIACLDICHGDSIEKVVYDLSSIVCSTKDALDISTLNFDCLVPAGQVNPTTLNQLLQLLITKSCETTTVEPGTGGGSNNLPAFVNLPACLITNPSETMLSIDDYLIRLADYSCELRTDIDSINTTVYNLNQQIGNIPTTGSGNNGGSSTTLTIQSKCFSATQPGNSIGITTAFETMEGKLCDLFGLIGTSTHIGNFNAINCINGSTPLPCGTGTYSSIQGWVPNPTTAFQVLTNMQLAICKLDECAKFSPSNICVALPPTNIVISDLSVTGCRVTWTNPLTVSNPDLEDPISIVFKFFIPGTTTPIALTGGATSIEFAPSASQGTNNNIVDLLFTTGQPYTIKAYAKYNSCGESISFAETTSILKTLNVTAKIVLTVSNEEDNKICTNLSTGTPSAYTEKRKKYKLSIFNPLGTTQLTNGTGQAIVAKIKIFHTNPCNRTPPDSPPPPQPPVNPYGLPIVEIEEMTITIPSNAHYGENSFVELEKTYCGSSYPFCAEHARVFFCFKEITLADGSPLPSGVGLDSTITSLQACQ